MRSSASKANTLIAILTSLALATIILCVAYPGFMSYDSLVMIDEARNGVIGAPYNPGPVYILRLFDIFGEGPAALLFCEAFTIFFSSFSITRRITGNFKFSMVSQLLLAATPLVAGCLFVLWKDNIMLALALSATSMMFAEPASKNISKINKWITLILIFLVGLMRINALPLVIALVIIWLKRFTKLQGLNIKSVFATLGLAALSMVFLQASMSFRLPDLQRLPANDVAFMTLKYDLYGISYFGNVQILPLSNDPSISGSLPMSVVRESYSPIGGWTVSARAESMGVSQLLDDGSISNPELVRIWFEKVLEHPLAYLQYRTALFSQTIGAVSGEVFEPTHYGRIDENNLGFKFSERPLTSLAVAYVWSATTTLFGKPFFALVISTFLWILTFRKRIGTQVLHTEVNTLVFGSWAYLLTFYVLPPTGEVRYSMPSLALLTIIGCICFWHVKERTTAGSSSKHRKIF